MFNWHRALTAEQITNSMLLKMLFEIRAQVLIKQNGMLDM